MKKLKNWIVSSAKNLWGLNWEAKIGILFIIPPIIGVIMFIVEFLHIALFYYDFPEDWYKIWCGSFSQAEKVGTLAVPLYLGLMAIAGAYLIKGNLKKKE